MNNKILLKTNFGNIEIGDNLPVHLIAEIGLNHNGSVEIAKNMIYSAVMSGASFVKFQKRTPESLATKEFLDAPFPKCPSLGTTQREVRERLELSFSDYEELINYSNKLGVIFFASAFDIPSFEFLMELNVPIIKIASHSITNGPLLKKIAESKIPVICSFGGVSERESDIAFEFLSPNKKVIMHCTSAYPTPDDLVFIDTINYLKEKHKVPVGFSSHENGIDISYAAAIIGACIIERHFTINRAMIGLDQMISLNPKEFSDLAIKVKRINNIRGVKKEIDKNEYPTKNNYHVGLYANKDITKGMVINEEDIICLQPLVNPELYFSGLEFDKVTSARAKLDINKNELIPREAIED
jgi:sialic acid synthase